MATATQPSDWHTYVHTPHLSLVPRWAPAPETLLIQYRRIIGRFTGAKIVCKDAPDGTIYTHRGRCAVGVEADLRRRSALLALRALRDVTGFTVAALIEGGRRSDLIEARHAFWIVLNNQGLSTTTIGGMCDRDHSTIATGMERVLLGRRDAKAESESADMRVRDTIRQVEDRIRALRNRRGAPEPHAYVVPVTDVTPPNQRSLWDALRVRLPSAGLCPRDQQAVYDYLRGPLLGLQPVHGTMPAWGLQIIARVAAVYRAVAGALVELGCAPYLSVIVSAARSLFQATLGLES